MQFSMFACRFLPGISIPFPNLGLIIPEMIPVVNVDVRQQLQYLAAAHLMNAFQVNSKLPTINPYRV